MEGLEYELLVENLYKILSPNAIIKHNDKIQGPGSKYKRQIDLSIRHKLANTDILIIIEAKDYNKKAGVKVIDQFISVIKEIHANKGIIISSQGFTKNALDIARKNGIECLSIHSANKKSWETIVFFKVKRILHYFDVKNEIIINIKDLAGKPVRLENDIFSIDKKNLLTLNDLIVEKIINRTPWNSLKKKRTIKLNLKDSGILYYLNEEFREIHQGYIEIKYIKSVKKSFFIKPDNYLYEVQHHNNYSQLHSMDISIDRLNNIFFNDEEIDSFSENDFDPHIDVESFIFKDIGVSTKFTTKLHINLGGEKHSKDNKILISNPLNDRFVKIENRLSEY